MSSSIRDHVTTVKILLAAPGIDVNKKDEVSDLFCFTRLKD